MSRQICHVVNRNQSGTRLDLFLSQLDVFPSRSAAVKSIEEGRVLVNNAPSNKKQILSNNDVIVCDIDDSQTTNTLYGYPTDLDIRYEDNDLIVLSKPAGMLTHPSSDNQTDTLVNALIYRYGQNGLCNVQGDADRLGIVHRLDAETSGLMLAAKTNDAGVALMDSIRLREVDRRYICLVHGIVAPNTAMIDAPIARDVIERKRMCISDSQNSRDAITTFNVLQRFSPSAHDMGFTLLECKLYTGRTHQIRVHMQYTKHPVVGDPIYFKNAPKDKRASLGLERQFLHSYKLGLTHPISGESLQFFDELPIDLLDALNSISDRCIETTDYGNDALNLMYTSKKDCSFS